MVRPPEAESLGRADPGGGDRASLPRCPCPLGFYEAEFVRTRCENSFFLFLIHFWPPSGNNSPFRLWCLIAAVRGNERRKDQTPKSVTLSSAQRSWLKASNGINGRGPPEAGRMPFMPAVSLNQWSGALPKRGDLLSS
jgi:hypothetical protein